MDRDEVWQTIDDERCGLADFLDDLSASEWETPSLCADWRVRDVVAHLTLAHTGPLRGALWMLRARGNFNRMVRDSALWQARLPVEQLAARLRDMVGSREKAVGVTYLEPLIDILVHGQDIAIPLARSRLMPAQAAATAATRVWSMGWPFGAKRKLSGLRFVATDHSWSCGQGLPIEGPMAAILLLLTGRRAALPQLCGPGVAELDARLFPAARLT
jgi:uncharacterized protein (TIGR03083 family)